MTVTPNRHGTASIKFRVNSTEQERAGAAVELGDELPTAGSGNGACQPPCEKASLGSLSGPPGACITPPTVRNV